MGSVAAATETQPAYGKRLLPVMLDELAATKPGRVYGAIPKTADPNEGFRDITIADFARCVNHMAHWIESRFGRSDTFETLSYVPAPDFRGAVFQVAATKTGYKLLLPSPRLPPATIIHLMKATGSTKLFHPQELAPIVKGVADADYPIHKEAVPSFQEMLDSSPSHYPYTKTWAEAKDDPVVVLHSSGSTNVPKPITWTHAAVGVLDRENGLPEIPGRKRRGWNIWMIPGEEPGRVYTVFPFFHLAGWTAHCIQPIMSNSAQVLGPPHLMPDGSLLKSVMAHQQLSALFVPPAIIEQLLKEPGGIDLFRGLQFITYSGAPFNPTAGDRLKDVVPLVSPFGCTEIGALPELFPEDVEDWEWHEFADVFAHELQLYDEAEGTYELVLAADASVAETNAVHHNQPGLTEFRTRDLFVRHPTKPTLWKFYGRRDDIIVLANGEKFNPVPLEVAVQNHPRLKGAYVVGSNRTQSALLVEPKDPIPSPADRAALVDELWPLIEKANELVPGQGRILRGKVLVGLPEKPFSRTGKGTIVRKLTTLSYEDEINTQLYGEGAAAAAAQTVSVALRPAVVKAVYDNAAVSAFVRGILAVSFPAASEMGEEDDLFSYGLDSVQTLAVVANLKRNLAEQKAGADVSWINPRTVFQHSSIAGLTAVLLPFLNDGVVPAADTKADKVKVINDMVEKYVSLLPAAPPTSTTAKKTKKEIKSIALIGSTGYLGTRLVATYLRDPSITHIYCLNRSAPATAQSRQESALASLSSPDLVTPTSLAKLSYMSATLGAPRLGLSDADYAALRSSADAIVLNAWRLDFGHSLHSFAPLLQSVVDVVGLAATTTTEEMPRIVFVSSISSAIAHAFGPPGTPAPESAIADPSRGPIDVGYGQSKYVAERVLESAAKKLGGLDAVVARVTQVGGPSSSGEGKWADQPWVSAIARTSRTLGAVPVGVAPVNWLPVDTVAGMLGALSTTGTTGATGGATDTTATATEGDGGGARYYNLVHPSPAPWSLFTDALAGAEGYERLSLPAWLGRVRGAVKGKDGAAAEDVERLPALKMMDYYGAMGEGSDGDGNRVQFETKDTIAATKSSVEVPALTAEMMGRWLRDWGV